MCLFLFDDLTINAFRIVNAYFSESFVMLFTLCIVSKSIFYYILFDLSTHVISINSIISNNHGKFSIYVSAS